MLNDNSDIESIFDGEVAFKPLTKGLGFHHSVKDKNEISQSLRQKTIELKVDLESRATILNNNSQHPVSANMGELSAFYETKKPETKLAIENLKIETPETPSIVLVDEASHARRFLAFLVDQLIICSFMAMALGSVAILAQIPNDFIRELFESSEIVKIILPIYFLMYLFYFSFFDKTYFATPGKYLFGVKVRNLKNESPTMLQSTMRAFLTSLSILTLGLLVVLDLQNKLTDTKVVKWEND